MWSAGLLAASGIVLVIFVNLVANWTIPRTVLVTVSEEDRIESSDPDALVPPGATLPSEVEFSPSVPSERANQDALDQIRLFSVVGLLIVVPAGAVAAYWISGRSLRPVRVLSETASRIEASSLPTRVAVPDQKDELRQLAVSFNSMLDRLDASFRQQNQFVDDAAHELRTPLSVFKTNLQVASDDPAFATTDAQEFLKSLLDSAARLERLTNDLLVLAQEDRLPTLGPVWLGVLLDEVKSELAATARDRGVTVDLDGDLEATAMGDAGLLKRVFFNLIENAIFYNRPDGHIWVTVAERTDQVEIRVKDSGIGIDPLDRESIFDRFARADESRSRNDGGAGLGLAISKQIVKRHGGHIEVFSSPGEGSTFLVKLRNG